MFVQLSPESLGREIVTLYVGPERKVFTIHKKLLCDKSEYFNAAFNHGFGEGSSNEIHLPEDDPEVITSLVNFVYRDCVPDYSFLEVLPEEKPWSTLSKEKLYPLFSFAEKVCYNGLANKVMDAIQDSHNHGNGYPGIVHAKLIYGITRQNSKLRQYLVLTWVRKSLRSSETWKVMEDERLPLFEEIPDLAKDFAIAVAKYNSLIHGDKLLDTSHRDDSRAFGNCFFHIHKDNEVCHLVK